ncbi:hypothetical protein BV22DRAFT_1103930 [Leucogyrophana mollusca]|uniref:Uncharacterized protein n=1 Tax=Leucogyrophana mollusca TaxID=85980 RepID=A0ACB8BNE0_9AGAM|nr:hypothetical protein BV22DRAFT_1103930 [Leucogyrophana mollusca]
MDLKALVGALRDHEFSSLLDTPLVDVLNFFRLCCIALPAIQRRVVDIHQAPTDLPVDVLLLLSAIFARDVTFVRDFWNVLRTAVWVHGEVFPTEHEIKDDHVSTLTDPVTHKATLFTLRDGAIPVHSTSTYCRKCHHRYHHNYRVHKSSSERLYYGGVPRVIQAAQHFFLESSLLELFAVAKVFGWLSSMNCARVYNEALAVRHSYILNNKLAFSSIYESHLDETLTWPCSLRLRDADVLNGFFLYSLLLDKAERGSLLILPHDAGSQKLRIEPALMERNKEMEGIGQEAYPHACGLCFIVFEDDDGRKMKIQPAVCDGNTIGHPCCAVHDCKIPLITNNHRFCADHAHLRFVCAVEGCSVNAAPGFRTCDGAEHRACELAYFRPAKALFQLRAKLKKAGISIPSDSVPSGEGADDEEVIIECDGKADEGNQKLRARFGRRRTHNEQLIMRPCGVILSRATFFGSEAISSVNDFAKATFPTPGSTPEYFVFDNNCKLRAHQDKIKDTHFSQTGMPVDVFHFKSKHKETDLYCQRQCNPAAFPELIQDGKWRFNTSVCEQTNVWLGGYQAILRDMGVYRFNFYLDEMIKRRNRYVISELRRKGHEPWKIHIDALFRG